MMNLFRFPVIAFLILYSSLHLRSFLQNDTMFLLMSAVENNKDADPDEVFAFLHRGVHPSHDSRHICYLARAHSTFYDSISGKLLLTYDCNSTEFSHVASSEIIYIPRVLTLDLPDKLR